MSYKTKQFLFFILKVAVVIGAAYFIYQKIGAHETVSVGDFIDILQKNLVKNPIYIFILLLFSLLNWVLEIKKWQHLVSYIKPISFSNATKQSLGSLTASLLTPNRIGEYGAKAMYYKKGNRRKVMLLNLISNMAQMAVTVVLGLISLSYFFIQHPEILANTTRAFWIYLGITLLIFSLGTVITLKKIRGFYIDKIKHFIYKIPIPLTKTTMFFSFFRYVIFSHQLYYLLWIFRVHIEYVDAISAIGAMYLIASIIPSISFFDWLIKGSVAVWVFAFYGAEEFVIVSLSLFMWFMNFGLPALVGSYYVINFKLNQRL
ncbi:hypothetical protein MWU59_00815 [Flavobacteriaceae bacterium F08102]|nr:hypothetical protein [Flavobacteriaceae bacterium F08102]